MDADFSNQQDWLEALTELSTCRNGLAAPIQERVDTALDWLDVAALTENWRVMLPAIFSAMESLLVPEEGGTKAAAVTVRSVAVHVALGHGFFNPQEANQAYLLRSGLVHGRPTGQLRDDKLVDFAEGRRRWAFLVLTDYLKLATRERHASVESLVAYLDEVHGPAVCKWLEDFGAAEVVREYHAMLSPAAPGRGVHPEAGGPGSAADR